MAKKAVASLQKGGSKKLTKAIKMVKGKKGDYVFIEKIISVETVNEWLTKK